MSKSTKDGTRIILYLVAWTSFQVVFLSIAPSNDLHMKPCQVVSNVCSYVWETGYGLVSAVVKPIVGVIMVVINFIVSSVSWIVDLIYSIPIPGFVTSFIDSIKNYWKKGLNWLGISTTKNIFHQLDKALKVPSDVALYKAYKMFFKGSITSHINRLWNGIQLLWKTFHVNVIKPLSFCQEVQVMLEAATISFFILEISIFLWMSYICLQKNPILFILGITAIGLAGYYQILGKTIILLLVRLLTFGLLMKDSWAYAKNFEAILRMLRALIFPILVVLLYSYFGLYLTKSLTTYPDKSKKTIPFNYVSSEFQRLALGTVSLDWSISTWTTIKKKYSVSVLLYFTLFSLLQGMMLLNHLVETVKYVSDPPKPRPVKVKKVQEHSEENNYVEMAEQTQSEPTITTNEEMEDVD